MDLGLPSGTLWLDRMVGAPSPTETGLFYQWGDTIGHNLAEGYEFSLDSYAEKGLDLISSDLDNAHDAARAYYGPEAKIPSYSQLTELRRNCVISNQGNGVIQITSNINGHSIKLCGNGYIENLEQEAINKLRAWTNQFRSTDNALSIHVDSNAIEVYDNARFLGYNVLAVHS